VANESVSMAALSAKKVSEAIIYLYRKPAEVLIGARPEEAVSAWLIRKYLGYRKLYA